MTANKPLKTLNIIESYKGKNRWIQQENERVFPLLVEQGN